MVDSLGLPACSGCGGAIPPARLAHSLRRPDARRFCSASCSDRAASRDQNARLKAGRRIRTWRCSGCGGDFQGRKRRRCRRGCGRVHTWAGHLQRCRQCGKDFRTKHARSQICGPCHRRPTKVECPVCSSPFFPWRNGYHARKTCGAEACMREFARRARRGPGPPPPPPPDPRMILAGVPCLSCTGPVDRAAEPYGVFCSPWCRRKEKRRLQCAGIRFSDVLKAVVSGTMPAAWAIDIATAWPKMRAIRKTSTPQRRAAL